jgi:uncharacterized metal-binding protein YceD (DUF177 family)
MKQVDDIEIIYVNENNMVVDMAQDVYDWVMLALPIRKVPCESLETCERCPPAIKHLFVEEIPDDAGESTSPWDSLKPLLES